MFWRNKKDIILLGANSVITAITGDTVEEPYASIIIPAGTLAVGDIIRFSVQTHNDEAGDDGGTLRCRLGNQASVTSNNTFIAINGATKNTLDRDLFIRIASATSYEVRTVADVQVAVWVDLTTLVRSTNFDIATENRIDINVLSTHASNTYTCRYYSAEVIKAK